MPVAQSGRRGSKSAPRAASPQFVRAAIKSEHSVETGRKRKRYHSTFGAVSKLIWFMLIAAVLGAIGFAVYHAMQDNSSGNGDSSAANGPPTELVHQDGFAAILPVSDRAAYTGTLLGNTVRGSSWISTNDGTTITVISFEAASLAGADLAGAAAALDAVVDDLVTSHTGTLERVAGVPAGDMVARNAFIKIADGYVFATVYVKGTRVVTILAEGPSNEVPPLYSRVINSVNLD